MKYDLKDIIDKLTGSVYPAGDSDIDDKILHNVEHKAELMIALIEEFIEVMAQRNRPESSVNRVVSAAASALADIQEKIQELVIEMNEEGEQ